MTSALRSTEVLTADQVEQYLNQARAICSGSQMIDIHVHATEVIRDKIEYAPLVDEVRSSDPDKEYRSPGIAGVRVKLPQAQRVSPMQLRMSELAFTRAYQHTGPRVLADQLDLSGVNKAVLLPVARANRSLTRQMQIIGECCRGDDRFVAGYSISNDVPDEQLDEVLAAAVEEFQVRILKVHPNLSGIDLSTKRGISRIEAILRACDRLHLPLLFHGGCSPILGDSPAREYSTIEKLYEVDWSLTASAVVIAHFGVYGCEGHASSDFEGSVALLKELLKGHTNIYTDTSGVPYDAIENMLGVLDVDRVVFGSDALYVPMYRQLSLVMHALHVLDADPEHIKVIACKNPARVLGD